jgi:glutaconyl-CoA/methylmalonyl-CoA decarboxylase subunit gamma
MRRYTLGIDGREFVIDVQEVDADRFEVSVGDQRYEVTLAGDDDLPEAGITPGLQSTPGGEGRARPAATPMRTRAAPAAAVRTVAPSRPAAGGSGAALNAPMPGVILELYVKAGDKVERGQQIAVLDAMKMHNFIGAPRAGTIAEVCVAAGQAVGHGDAIVRFAED